MDNNGAWDKILTDDFYYFVKNLSDVEENGWRLERFVDYVHENVNYKFVVVLATQWKGYDEFKQTEIAIGVVGEEFASHFMMMMDFLSAKFLKGELK